jgi:hypothetical protein
VTKKLSDIGNQELANFLGISKQFASGIRKGTKKLPVKDCVRVSARYNLSLHYLRPDIFPETPHAFVDKRQAR